MERMKLKKSCIPIPGRATYKPSTHTIKNEHNYSTTASNTTLIYSSSFQATSKMAFFQTEAIYVGDHYSITTTHCLTCAVIVARCTGNQTKHTLPTHIANSNLRLPEIDGIHSASYLCCCLCLCILTTVTQFPFCFANPATK
jgi:hypothetical protein